ncbi:MAG: mechanosensitive ion channel [Synechococcales bacterium]|nr:mechanosensitive ion channel [Synechococcales bacterium]
MNEIWLTASRLFLLPPPASYLLGQERGLSAFDDFSRGLAGRFGTFIPNLLGAIAILIIGWLVATVAASLIKGLLNRTSIDNRIANWLTGQAGEGTSPPIENWTATAVYWIILLFTLVAVFNALNLDIVSGPLNDFLEQIFAYLPRIGGALLILGLAWLVATIAKLALTRGLARFNLDDKLAEQTGNEPGNSPFLVNETLGNIVYWFIFLIFLPLVLETLDLQDGTLGPLQNLIDEFLSILPNIFAALLIGLVGWFIARIVRGIVTNLLASTGINRLGTQMGLRSTAGQFELSDIIGTLVYVLILIPVAVAALNALEIQAISAPAISMLETVLDFIPRLFSAAVIMTVFYIIGRFASELTTMFLTSLGFNNIFNWLGLPKLQAQVPSEPVDTPPPAGEPATPYVRPTAENQLPQGGRTPSEVVGITVFIGTLLFGAVAAADAMELSQWSEIVRNVLAISLRILSGLIVFGLGLYLANVAFNLISSPGSSQSRILAQTARIAIITLISAMALQQIGVATDIVNLAFGLLLGAIAVAIALAFGLGGRDIAAEQIREWLNSFKQRS